MKEQVKTHRLKGELGFLQVLMTLDMQHLGSLVDATEVGSTAESIRGEGKFSWKKTPLMFGTSNQVSSS